MHLNIWPTKKEETKKRKTLLNIGSSFSRTVQLGPMNCHFPERTLPQKNRITSNKYSRVILPSQISFSGSSYKGSVPM